MKNQALAIAVTMIAAFTSSACDREPVTAVETLSTSPSSIVNGANALGSDVAIQDVLSRIIADDNATLARFGFREKLRELLNNQLTQNLVSQKKIRRELLESVEVAYERASLAERIDLDVLRLALESTQID